MLANITQLINAMLAYLLTQAPKTVAETLMPGQSPTDWFKLMSPTAFP